MLKEKNLRECVHAETWREQDTELLCACSSASGPRSPHPYSHPTPLRDYFILKPLQTDQTFHSRGLLWKEQCRVHAQPPPPPPSGHNCLCAANARRVRLGVRSVALNHHLVHGGPFCLPALYFLRRLVPWDVRRLCGAGPPPSSSSQKLTRSGCLHLPSLGPTPCSGRASLTQPRGPRPRKAPRGRGV